MKTLIIYAHPKHESHAQTTLEFIETKLKKEKKEYEVLDLYSMNFNPVLSYEEIYEVKQKGLSKEILELQQKVADANHLILIYPIWWNGMPAIIKGFIDRVFSSGFAFKYEGKIPKGLLKGKTADVFVTTGAGKLASGLFLGNRFKKNADRDILGFCGIKTKVYHVGDAYALTESQKEKILKNVGKALG